MLTLLTLGIGISNAFNDIYVEAVDTFSTQCKFHKIQDVSTLSIHAASCMQQHKEPPQKFSLYMLTLSINNIAYTIHNSIALILCIDCLNLPFNVQTTDKVTMITVNGFLTI